MPISPIRILPELFNPSGVAFGWSSLLTYCREGLSLVSLWDERAVPFALRQKAPLVRLPTRACPRRPAQVFLGRHRFYFVSTSFECPPHTETSDTSERNLETKFSKRVADTTDHLGL